MTQGDEQIILFTNYGNFEFKQTTLLRFQAVYGSSYLEVDDFDKDGHFDILCTNGDNADYSAILKPYHGIRLFRNDGKNNFEESWFYPLHGATQVRSNDYDQDGDLDIAAIAYFPDYESTPERGFVYLENKHGVFTPFVTPLSKEGRWITMDAADVDDDGDCDLVLGAFSSDGSSVPQPIFNRWKTQQTSLLYLKNLLK
jgi:hypothetical protein